MALTRYYTKERAQGQLLGAITSNAVSLTLKAGEGAEFPSSFPFIVTLEKVSTNAYGVKTVTQFEDVKVTGRSTDTLTIQRGFNGTTAAAFAADDYVSLYVSALIIDDIQQAVQDLETNKLTRSGQLRLGLTAWTLPYHGASGNEVELAFSTSGYVLQTNGATSAPTWVAPTVNITGLTEDTTPDHANDFLVSYDTSAGSNKKVKFTSYAASDAEAIAGSNTVKYITPKHLGDAKKFTILQSSRAINAASGNQVIAHGLGLTPKFIEAIARHHDGTATEQQPHHAHSHGFSNFSTHGCTYYGQVGSNGTYDKVNYFNVAKLIYIQNTNSATANHGQTQECTASADGTNVTLAWTYTLTGSSSLSNTIYFTLLVAA